MIQPPLVVDSGGDISLFRDARALERGLEAIDVQNGEYVVYDSEGRLVALTTEEVPTRVLFGLLRGKAEAVRIASAEPEPAHASELGAKLRAFLERLGEEASLSATSLPELIERLRERAGFTI